MSCCSSTTSPKGVAALAMRLGFGLSILLIGVHHYMNLSDFIPSVSMGLGPLVPAGIIWAYILPALLIIGGALISIGLFVEVGAWTAGVALGSIAPGLLLKTLLSDGQIGLEMVMPMVINTLIWLLVFFFVVKSMSCCGGKCGTEMKK